MDFLKNRILGFNSQVIASRALLPAIVLLFHSTMSRCSIGGMEVVDPHWAEKLALEIRSLLSDPAVLAKFRDRIRDWSCRRRGQEIALLPDPDRDAIPPAKGATRPFEITLYDEYALVAAFHDAYWECFWRIGEKIDPWHGQSEENFQRRREEMPYAVLLSKFMDKPNPTVEMYRWTLPQSQEWFIREALTDVRRDVEEMISGSELNRESAETTDCWETFDRIFREAIRYEYGRETRAEFTSDPPDIWEQLSDRDRQMFRTEVNVRRGPVQHYVNLPDGTRPLVQFLPPVVPETPAQERATLEARRKFIDRLDKAIRDCLATVPRSAEGDNVRNTLQAALKKLQQLQRWEDEFERKWYAKECGEIDAVRVLGNLASAAMAAADEVRLLGACGRNFPIAVNGASPTDSNNPAKHSLLDLSREIERWPGNCQTIATLFRERYRPVVATLRAFYRLFCELSDFRVQNQEQFARAAAGPVLLGGVMYPSAHEAAAITANLFFTRVGFAARTAAGYEEPNRIEIKESDFDVLLDEVVFVKVAEIAQRAYAELIGDEGVSQLYSLIVHERLKIEGMTNQPLPRPVRAVPSLPTAVQRLTDEETKRRATIAFEAANDLLTAIDEYRQWDGRKIGWYRDAPEDCLQALEKIARAGRVAMQRLEDCRLKSAAFSDLQADASPMHCWPWPPSELVDVETYVDPRYRDDWIRDGAVVFDMLPAELKQILDWLERAPSEILLPSTASEIPQRTVPTGPQHLDGLPFSQVQAAMIDETGVEVLKIVKNPNLSADQKMRAVGRVDRRYDGFNSPKWGELLGVTPEAVRQTDRWKELQQAKHAGPE